MIQYVGISVNDKVDTLRWNGILFHGHPMVAYVYRYILLSMQGDMHINWFYKVWQWHMPTKKIKKIGWLLWRNRILTWENLWKKGFVGTGRCPM